ncbi:MAG: AraC family transcriptional regulator, partial [Clostridiales bacterium]|nr:AraC family transcriptional regulator [Clostridiales bacterium]
IQAFINKPGNIKVGKMSGDPLRQSLYGFISTTSLATRAAIEGGLDEPQAYNLSDCYIQKVDKLQTVSEILALYTKMLSDFAARVGNSKERPIYSKPIQEAIEYIDIHLHEKIKLEQIAAHAAMSTGYLSKCFKQETGQTLTDFIQKAKMEEAKESLQFSQMSILEISSILQYSSQSYFSQVFRQHTGLTPQKYREVCQARNAGVQTSVL